MMNDAWKGSDMQADDRSYVVYQSGETTPVFLASTANTWQGASFVFRMPDDQDGAVDDAGNPILSRFHYRNDVYIKNTGASGAGNIYLTDLRLYDLSLLLMNVLEKQGVTVTDGAGTTYAEGSDYTIEYGESSMQAGVRAGYDFGVFWTETQAFKKNVFNDDGSLKGFATKILWTGTTKPERVYVTYSSLFPSNQGNTCCSMQFQADTTLEEYDTQTLYPRIEADLNLYSAAGVSLPRWSELSFPSELRRTRTGTSPGQRSFSNAEYIGHFFGKVADKLGDERAEAGDDGALKPIVWHDMRADE